MPKIRIAIIGANSFLARNFISQLNRNNYDIFLYDIQEMHSDKENNYKKICLDFRNELLYDVNFDVDLLYVFSGKTGTKEGFENYKEYININEICLLNLLWSCVKSKSRAKIIYPSSRLVYKSSLSPVNEESDLDSKSVYAVTKIACEKYLKIFNDIYGLKFNIFRICVPYGTLIPNISSYGTYEFFTNQAKRGEDIVLYGDGSSKRTFTHIGDLCHILTIAPFLIGSDAGIYNVGGDTKSLHDIAKNIAEQYSVSIKFVEWPELDKKLEVENIIFDSSKLDSIINYKYKKL